MARFERDIKGVDTYDMNIARQHHKECNAHGEYDEMQKRPEAQCNITMMSIAYATNKRNNAKQDDNGKHTMPKKQNTRMEWHYREHGNNQMKYTTSTK